LVGINLLREGLDLPEVSLIAILDADKIGFLRSATSLIQIVGRAARNSEGHVIMYADKMSSAMEQAIGETNRRRSIQIAYNTEHDITPTTIVKAIHDLIQREQEDTRQNQKQDLTILKGGYNMLNANDRKKYIKALEKEMLQAAKNLEFERAAVIRDEIELVRNGEFNT
jgi:excinuclease ABC subunit B